MALPTDREETFEPDIENIVPPTDAPAGGDFDPDLTAIEPPAAAETEATFEPDLDAIEPPVAASPEHAYKASSKGAFLSPEDLAAAAVNPDGRKLNASPEFLRKAAGFFGGRAFADSQFLNPALAPADEILSMGEKLLTGQPFDDASKEHLPEGGLTEQAKYTLGRTLGMIAGDLPANTVRKAMAYLGQLTPDESEALVNLQGIIHDRKPWSEAASELGAQLLVGAKGLGAVQGLLPKLPGTASLGKLATVIEESGLAGKSAMFVTKPFLKHIATPAAVGAAWGVPFEVAKSKEGEELDDAIKGGLMGAAFGLGLHGVVGPLSWLAGTRERAAQYVADRMLDGAGGIKPVQARMAAMAAEDQAAETAMARLVKEHPKKELSAKAFTEGTSEAERAAMADLAARDSGRKPYVPREVKVSEDPLDVTHAEVISLGGEGELLYTAAAEAAGLSPQQLRDATAYHYAKQVRTSFSRLVKATDAQTPSIEAARGQQGAEYVDRAYDAFRTSERFGRAIKELSENALDPKERLGTLWKWSSALADNRAVLSAIDRRYGTTLAPTGDLISGRFNAATVVSAKLMGELDQVGKLTRKAEKTFTAADGTEATFTPEIMGEALNTGNYAALGSFTKKQKDALKAMSDLQETARQAAESFHDFRGLRTDKAADRLAAEKPGWFSTLEMSPVKITQLARGEEGTYLHNTTKDPVNYVLALTEHIEKLGGLEGLAHRLERSGTLGKSATQRGEGAAADALKGLEIWAGDQIKDKEGLKAAFQMLRRFDMDGEALQTRAAALLERTDQIPAFLLEKDPFKAFSRWTLSTFRHAAARDGIVQYLTTASALEKENPVLAEYLTNLSKDLSGVRRGTLAGGMRAWWTKQQLELERRARMYEASGKSGSAAVTRAVANFDSMYSNLVAGQYTYFLGMNPLTAAKNLVQPFVTTFPALGTSDPITASGMVLNAYRKAGSDILRRSAKKNLLAEGLVPEQQTYEAHQWFDQGMRAATGGGDINRTLGRASRAISRASMFMFEAADTVNRSVTRHLARDMVETLAADLPRVAGGKGFTPRGKVAAEAFASAEPAYRQSILDRIRAGDIDGATHETTRYLNGATQYNYNRAAMSAYGRAVGGAFSMFTKWPSVAAGDILTLLDAKKAGSHGEFERRTMQALWKYLGPTALAFTATQMGWKEMVGDSPRAKALAGRDPGGWGAQSAMASLFGHFGMTRQAESMFPPIATGTAEAVGSLVTGDLRGFTETLGETALSGLPNAVYLRFMLRDAPAIFLDKEIEGSTTVKKISNEMLGVPDKG